MSEPHSDPAYALARSQAEYDRLARQGAFLRGTTERLFRAAGLGPGMHVLDVGCGAGDVSLLAAELVGPDGRVIGMDIDGAALAVAQGRAESVGASNVTFVEGDARTPGPDDGFDAAVGRLVVMYWSDPADGLGRVAARVRPGGVLAFQDLDLNQATRSWSLPDETLWSQTSRLLVEAFARGGVQTRMGRRLYRALLAAGLPAPQMLDEALVGGGRDFGGYAWIAGVARSTAPLLAKLAIPGAAELGPETLAERLRDDAVAQQAVVWTPPLVGAYARKPRE